MAKTYRPYLPEQDFLLPPSPRDWLPEDHLAYFVSDLVDELDLSAITAEYEDEERGSPPYHPLMMTKVLVYAYCVGVFSSRKIQRRLAEDVGFRMLAAGNQPDFRTIADFRKLHLGALTGLFEQGLRMALEAGAVQLGRVALDGTKVQANASKHKAMSYGRMREKVRQLRDEVQQVLTQAEATDADEDARDGSDRRGDDLPAELQRRATRLQRIRAAKRALEVRARDEAAAAGQAPAAAKPEDKAQYNFTDPESRIMHGTGGVVQAYNAQVAVEDTLQLIVGHAVTQETNDKQQLQPMVATIQQQAGDTPDQLLVDSGYCSDDNFPPPHEFLGQPFGERRMRHVQAEAVRGWGLGGSPEGDRRGLSLAGAPRDRPVVGASQGLGGARAVAGRRLRQRQSAPWCDRGDAVRVARRGSRRWRGPAETPRAAGRGRRHTAAEECRGGPRDDE